MMLFSPTTVTTYSGYRADEVPRSFEIGGVIITVAEILEMWLERSVNDNDTIRLFRVIGSDGEQYLLRQEEKGGTWSYKGIGGKNLR